MHPAVMDFVERVLAVKDVADKTVLEVGAFDVNGSVRPYVQSLRPKTYVATDMRAGPGVDMIVDCERLPLEMGYDAWDVVVCAEMLEHARDWRLCMRQMAAAVAPGGLLLLTTRSPGFPYHPFPEDHWRFTQEDMGRIVEALKMDAVTIDDDPQAPGVFVLARKRFELQVASTLEHIDVADAFGHMVDRPFAALLSPRATDA